MPSLNNIQDTLARLDDMSLDGDLNTTVARIQREIGQTDGGVAGNFFSALDHPEKDWLEMDTDRRKETIKAYLGVEMAYVEDSPSP